jgi:hypothetical protein
VLLWIIALESYYIARDKIDNFYIVRFLKDRPGVIITPLFRSLIASSWLNTFLADKCAIATWCAAEDRFRDSLGRPFFLRTGALGTGFGRITIELGFASSTLV